MNDYLFIRLKFLLNHIPNLIYCISMSDVIIVFFLNIDAVNINMCYLLVSYLKKHRDCIYLS